MELMKPGKHHRHHLAHFIIRTALQVASIAVMVQAVCELDKIRHHLKHIEHKGCKK